MSALPLFAVVGLLLSACVWADGVGKTEADVLTLGHRFILPSDALGEGREVLVHLPEEYVKSRQRYPLLFILDGDSHFDYASGVAGFLARNGRAPELIVVAVANMGKRYDMSPPGPLDRKTMTDRFGRGDKFMSFMIDELVPWLDAHYRTSPSGAV